MIENVNEDLPEKQVVLTKTERQTHCPIIKGIKTELSAMIASETVSLCVLYTELFAGNMNILIYMTESAKSCNSVSVWASCVFDKSKNCIGHYSLIKTLP